MKRYRTLVSAVLGLFLAGTAGAHRAAGPGDSAAVPRISASELKQAVEKKQAIVVDVRGADAYRTRHIAGALQASGDELLRRAEEFAKSGKTIVTYCT